MLKASLESSQSVRPFAPALVLAFLVLAVAGCGGSPDDAGFARIEPVLIAPEEGTQIDRYPRYVDLSWHKVAGAQRYMIEIEMQNPDDGVWMPAPVGLSRRIVDSERMRIKFPGMQPGRWRVVAINENGVQSQNSEWRTFEFLQ